MKPMQPMEPMRPMEPMAETKPWWPAGLGEPSSSGGQDDVRYAFFPDKRRLLVRSGDETAAYDSGDRTISGIAQRQNGSTALAFTDQHGPVRLAELRRLRGAED